MGKIRNAIDSEIMKSSILGASGLIAITIGGLIVYVAGVTFNLDYLSTPFIDEMDMLVKFPLFFLITAIIKILIGGKMIELLVKYISKMLGIKEIIIAPDKPLIIVKKSRSQNS